VIWIGKDNQAIHLNLTREIAYSARFKNLKLEQELAARQQEIVQLEEKIAAHKMQIKTLQSQL